MDAVEVLELCARASREVVPADVTVPKIFTVAEYEATWRLDPVRVRRILDDLLCGAYPDTGLELLMQSGALDALFPELVAVKNLGDENGLHKDVWEHSKQVVKGVPADVELRWSALLHDVGKAKTRRITKTPRGQTKVTFHNHDVVGAKMIDRLDARLGLFATAPRLHDTVRTLVLNHLRPASYSPTWTDSGVRRLVADLGGPAGFAQLMQLSRADLTTKRSLVRALCVARANDLEARVNQVLCADASPKLPKGTMGLIIAKRVLPVGPWLNVFRDNMEKMLATGELPTDKDAEWYATEGVQLYFARHGRPQ